MANSEMSYDTKLLITILLLVFVYPVGVFFMYRWMKWNSFLKGLVALPLIFIILAIAAVMVAGFSSTANPSAQIEKAQQQSIQAR